MENSTIEWTDHTFNPWIGCTKVSTGCKNCYAEAYANRFPQYEWGPTGKRVKTSPNYWKQPIKWDKLAKENGRKDRVFCASLADVFEVSIHNPQLGHWKLELFDLIDATPNLIWLLLTKRPENITPILRNPLLKNHNLSNVWYGTSVENQETADTRIPELLKVSGKRFLSMEPLLEYVAFGQYGRGIDWVIVGGESGRNARATLTADMVNCVHFQCTAHNIPFFFKQWGRFRHAEVNNFGYGYTDKFTPYGKKRSGATVNGRIIQELPKEFTGE